MTAPNWLDGVIAGLGAAAVCARLRLPRYCADSGRRPLGTVTQPGLPDRGRPAPGLVVGGFAVLSGRRKPPWILLASRMALNVVGDTSNRACGTPSAPRGWVRRQRHGLAHRHPADVHGRLDPTPAPSNPLMPGAKARDSSSPSWPPPPPSHPVRSASLPLHGRGRHRPWPPRHSWPSASASSCPSGGSSPQPGTPPSGRHRRAHRSWNRRHLFRVLDAFFTEGETADAGRSLAFLFVDLDHFKEINDSFGHPAGDELLRQLGDRLQSSLRDNDLLVRLGGDEFAVVLIDGDADYADEVAERLTASLDEPFILDVVRPASAPASASPWPPPTPPTAPGWCGAPTSPCTGPSWASIPYAPFEPRPRRGARPDAPGRGAAGRHRRGPARPALPAPARPAQRSRSWPWRRCSAGPTPGSGLLPPDNFLPMAEEAGLMRPITRGCWNGHGQCATWRHRDASSPSRSNISPTNLLDAGLCGRGP